MRLLFIVFIITLVSVSPAPTSAQTDESGQEAYYRGQIETLHDLSDYGNRHLLTLLEDPPRNRTGTWFAPDWIDTIETATLFSSFVYEVAAGITPPEEFQEVHTLTVNAFRLQHQSHVSFVRALRTEDESDFALAQYQAEDAREQLEEAQAYWRGEPASTFDEAVPETGPDCTWFLYQEEAQEAFAVIGDLFPDLDEDGNGVACDQLPSRSIRATPGQTIPEDAEAAELIRVIDDKTIEVRVAPNAEADGGEVARVRLIGIKPPIPNLEDEESTCPRWTASHYIARMLMAQSNKQLWLQSDQRNKTSDGSLLRYVWFEGEHDASPYMINELLLRDGIARFEGMYALVVHRDRLLAAEQAALDEGVGVWAC